MKALEIKVRDYLLLLVVLIGLFLAALSLILVALYFLPFSP